MGTVEDVKAAVDAAENALNTTKAVLADIEADTPDNVTVTGVTIHYSNGVNAEFALEDTGTGIPPTGGSGNEETASSPDSSNGTPAADKSPAEASGESAAPDAPAGSIPK